MDDAVQIAVPSPGDVSGDVQRWLQTSADEYRRTMNAPLLCYSHVGFRGHEPWASKNNRFKVKTFQVFSKSISLNLLFTEHISSYWSVNTSSTIGLVNQIWDYTIKKQNQRPKRKRLGFQGSRLDNRPLSHHLGSIIGLFNQIWDYTIGKTDTKTESIVMHYRKLETTHWVVSSYQFWFWFSYSLLGNE